MAETTATLSNEVKIYYDKVFLKRSMYELVLKEGAQMRSHSKNEGKTIWFNRYARQAIDTTALTEGENPDVCSITAENVYVVLAEYGRTFKISRFLTLTSIDVNNREKISLLGQHMGETLNRIVRNELENGTARIANGAAASTVAASDVLDGDEVRDIVEQLEVNFARPYSDGYYMGKVTPRSKTTLVKDSTWLNAKIYVDTRDLYKGEMGELYQVRFLLNKDAATSAGTGAASTVTLYHNYFHGADAVGCYDLSGDVPQLFIVPNSPDSGNPAGRFSLASWAGSYASKILNNNWILVSKSAG
jgi:N4-gp56 family major capsid protein